jgi:hypothetical protein
VYVSNLIPYFDGLFTNVGRFINRDDVDFSIASDLPATATITTIPPTYAGQHSEVPEYSVKRVHFNNVRNITLYIEDNYGEGDEDVSRLWYLGFKGEWMDLKDTPVVAVYEVRHHLPYLRLFPLRADADGRRKRTRRIMRRFMMSWVQDNTSGINFASMLFSFVGFDTWAFAMIVILGVLSTRFGLGRKSSFFISRSLLG